MRVEHSSKEHGVDLLVCLGVFVAVLAVLIPYLNANLETLRGTVHYCGDEGTLLYHAERIRQGEVLYRDFFDFQGLFGYLPFTIGFSFATPGARTGRIVMFLLMAVWGVVTYLTVREVTGKRWAGVLIALYLPLCVWPAWPFAYQHWIAGLWVTCAILLSIYGERTKFERTWIVAGIFSALGLWTSLSEGLPALASLFVSCAAIRYARRDRWQPLGYYAAGIAGVTLLFALFLAARGALGIAYHDLLVFPFESYRPGSFGKRTEYGFDGARYVKLWSGRGAFEGRVATVLVWMTTQLPKLGVLVGLAVALVLFGRVARRYGGRTKQGALPWPALSACVYAASLASLAVPVWTGVTVNDICHIGFIQQLSVIALTVLWAPVSAKSLERRGWRFVSAAQSLLGIALLLTIVSVGRFSVENARNAEWRDIDEAIFDDPTRHCPTLQARTRPEDRVVINYGGLSYLICRRHSAISFPHLYYGPYWAAQWPRAANEIASRRPRLLFLTKHDFRTLAAHEPRLRSMYIGYDGNYMLAEPRPGPPWTPGVWSYTLFDSEGRVDRAGRLIFEAGPGSPPYTGRFDDPRGTPLFTYLDGATVQVFDGAKIYVFRRDAGGTTMEGHLFEGNAVARRIVAVMKPPGSARAD